MAFTDTIREAIRALLPRDSILFPDEIREHFTAWHYGTDCTAIQPRFSALCFPATTEETAALIRFAYENGLPVVPSGGRTGYSGGAVARNGEIVISTERMNRIFGYDSITQRIHLQAGVVTRSAREFAKLHGRYFPVNFASSGSSTIGGNISTNAGGLHAVRYGTMRRWTAGVAGVTGTGEIFRTRPGLFKDNSGYDLKEILIGSEGTLACITEAYLNVTDPPKETRIVILSCDDFSAIGNAVGEILPSGMTLHAIEFFDRTSQKILSEWEGTVRFFESGRCFILVEYENFDEESEFAFFDGLSQRLGLIDVAYAQTEPQKREFWRRRELISESLLRNHSVYKADLAIPLVNMGLFLGEVETILSREAPEFSYTTFGHAGDGNIHLNLLKKRERDSFFHISPALEERLYRTVSKYGGSPSAEHGIGLVKTHLLKYSKTGEEIRIMKEIKRAFDPRSILNPGKILEI